MSHGSCSNCAFFDHTRTAAQKGSTTDGLCRFNPPVNQPGPTQHGLWPIVSHTDWCGHFAGTTATQVAAE